MVNLDFFKGKRVFLTGHTGFKGAYLSRILERAGAELTGYSLDSPTDPALFVMARVGEDMDSRRGDVRDFPAMFRAFSEAAPEIVIHMAAQPLVRLSYEIPRETYETNVMGTVNILECVRRSGTVRSFLNVTTDKVYLNKDENLAFTEDMPLDGHDPYSNSKSCSELVTHSYKRSFFDPEGADAANGGGPAPAVSTVRAGNVIGGGDFAADRLIPDCVRSAVKGESPKIRNPYSVRPFQHVLEPLFLYLQIAASQYDNPSCQGFYNVGPDIEDCINAGEAAGLFCRYWGDDLEWEDVSGLREGQGPHEAAFLRLDCSLVKKVFGWKSVWRIEKAISETAVFSRALAEGADARELLDDEIERYIRDSI